MATYKAAPLGGFASFLRKNDWEKYRPRFENVGRTIHATATHARDGSFPGPPRVVRHAAGLGTGVDGLRYAAGEYRGPAIHGVNRTLSRHPVVAAAATVATLAIFSTTVATAATPIAVGLAGYGFLQRYRSAFDRHGAEGTLHNAIT